MCGIGQSFLLRFIQCLNREPEPKKNPEGPKPQLENLIQDPNLKTLTTVNEQKWEKIAKNDPWEKYS